MFQYLTMQDAAVAEPAAWSMRSESVLSRYHLDIVGSCSSQLQPHIDVDQHRARRAEKDHPTLRPVDHHLRRRALALTLPLVPQSIPDDLIVPAGLDAIDLIAVLAERFLRHGQRVIGRDRVLLGPLPLRPRPGGADQEQSRGCQNSHCSHVFLPSVQSRCPTLILGFASRSY